MVILGGGTILYLLLGLGLVGVRGGPPTRETWNNVQHVHRDCVRVHVRDVHVTPWLVPHEAPVGLVPLVFCMCSNPRGLQPVKESNETFDSKNTKVTLYVLMKYIQMMNIIESANL